MTARRWWLVAAAWAALIFVMSSLPAGSLGDQPLFRFDKVIHAAVWAVLAAAIARALTRAGRGRAVVILLAVALATAYGGVDELHQSLVPGRDASWRDLIADLVGATVGATLATSPAIAAGVYRHRDG